MKYQYIAYDENKEMMKGILDVGSELMAEQALLRQGYQPLLIKPAAVLPPVEEMFPSFFNVKPKEVIMFSRQLATLLDAGISIVPALHLIEEQMNNRKFKKVVQDLLNDLRAGSSFSQALSRQNKVFTDLYCQLIAVGENTGGASDSLRQAADYLEKDAIMKKRIKKALTYPVMVAVVAVVVITVLMIFVLPKMMDMFSSMNVDLPITTRMLIALTDFINVHKIKLLAGMGSLVLATVLYIKHPSGRYQLDRFFLKAPVIGRVNLMNEMARFSRTLALLVHAGLPLPEILKITHQTSGNMLIKDALSYVRTELLQGEGLSGPMSRNAVFPRLLVQMVMVGEESGRLESTLDTVASSYEAEADETVNSMISMIEPVMTIVLALGVGFIALSVITPMYSMTGAFE